MTTADPNGPFLATARGERPSRRPLWIMRQAGRYLPEYREVRKQYSFLELCNTPAAACEVTMQPIRRYDMDAAILFTDLLVPVVPMGIELDYTPGPELKRTIQTADDVRGLKVPDPKRDLAPMLETVRLVREELDPQKALIGFVSAPFTLACYLSEGRGSKNWDGTRRMMHGEPATFDMLLAKIAECLIPLVHALKDSGCQAVQIFDSWAGVLSADDYARRCAPHTDKLLQAARDAGALAINFVNGAAQHIDRIAESPADIAAVDWRMPMREIRRRLPDDMAVQGNLDPATLFADEQTLRAEVSRVCREAGDSGHIFNLGHGITPQVDPEALAILVDEVRKS